MKDFLCNNCGECCTSFIENTRLGIGKEDIARWVEQERWDILSSVRFNKEGPFGWFRFKRGKKLDQNTTDAIFYSFQNGFGNLFDRELHDSIEGALLASSCPWIKKTRKGEILCKIHKTKPLFCKDWPRTKKQMLSIECKGAIDA